MNRIFLSIGRAQKNAKHGAGDKAKILMEAVHDKMTLREGTRSHLFKTIRYKEKFQFDLLIIFIGMHLILTKNLILVI